MNEICLKRILILNLAYQRNFFREDYEMSHIAFGDIIKKRQTSVWLHRFLQLLPLVNLSPGGPSPTPSSLRQTVAVYRASLSRSDCLSSSDSGSFVKVAG